MVREIKREHVVHSVDDSSYGIWWMNKPIDELKEIRTKVMKWINEQQLVNGEKFLDFCVSLGADEGQRDYN